MKLRAKEQEHSNRSLFRDPKQDRAANLASKSKKRQADRENGVKYNCVKCDESFTRQDSLNTHVEQMHSNSEQGSSASRTNARRTRDRKYGCTECDKSYTGRDSLNRHVEKMHPTSKQ